MSKPTLVAIYARVSTSEQNPESQLLALREYAARRGFSIYKEYVDHVSGDVEQRRAKRQNDRAYRELMDDASRRSFDCVLVWKYDRFARSLSILVAALQQFSTLGIDFISYTQNIDTTTPMGRLFYHVIGSFAEFEREIIIERVRAGRIKPSTILRRLATYSRKNKLYFAFRELGRVVRTAFLLDYISDIDLRRTIQAATNKSEAFNLFVQWVAFGGADCWLKTRGTNSAK